MKDDAESYSAIALNLPGAGSCGSTADEAVANAKEAVRAVLEEYKASNEEIPWRNSTGDDIPTGANHQWVLVDA